jgi:K+-sensing histidine kinase KdpD
MPSPRKKTSQNGEDSELQVLRSCLIFKDLSASVLKTISKSLKRETHAAGKILLDLKTAPDKVYIIKEGRVKISRPTSYGEEAILNFLEKGALLGELSVLDGRKRSAKATCVEKTTVYVITKAQFQKLLSEHPPVSQRLLWELCNRIRRANDNIIKRLEEQHIGVQVRFGKLQRLIEASKIINSTLDLDKLLGLILDSAIKSIEADRGTLYLVDDIKKELWSKVLQGDNMVEIRLPVGKGLSGHVAATGEVINIPDAYSDPRFNPEIDKKTGYRTRNMLCMPMKNKDGKIIGVFQLLNKKAGVFDDGDVQFIDALSAHASVAIENARLAQEMVSSERMSAVGRMAATIIHDIKNPMGTLRVYAQVMKKKSGNEEAAKLADEMIHQVDRFVNMTQEILDFSKGVSSLNVQEYEFNEVMESVLNFIEKDLSKNNVKLVRKNEFQGNVKLDQDKMVRVFYNIASNARDAMPQGGTLTVSTVKTKDGFVKIEFTDSGTGMPEEVKKRIFEPFMTYGKKHGTGLGMAIVKKVIDDHKGKIEIDSELGKGTTIRIQLPFS